MHCHQGLKLAFLTRYDRTRGSSRVRVYDYLPYLENAGCHCRVLPFLRRLSPVAKLGYIANAIWLARWADVVVLQKLVLREEFTNLLSRANPRLLFDFDDALWCVPDALSDNVAVKQRYTIHERRLQNLLSRVRGVIAGSHHLADYARCFTDRVLILPSSVDLGHYPIREASPTKGPTVFGWIGSPENLLDFRAMQQGLVGAFAELKGKAVLKVISSRPPELENIPVQWEPWVLDRQLEFLHSFDVGLMPMVNTQRSRGRCGFKAIQYMAAGIPVIASPVGAATAVVLPEETGLLPTSEEAWKEAILRLSEDESLRRRFGSAGRRRVEAFFSIQTNAKKLISTLQEVANP